MNKPKKNPEPRSKPRSAPRAAQKIDKYDLYERSVQSPDYHAEWFGNIYRELRGKPGRSMREDFCGTARMSCEWVKLDSANTAVGLDLDPEPLAYGRERHIRALAPAQRKRIQLLERDVLKPPAETFDLINACNFSYCVFKRRETLLKYFRACLRSLKKDGVLLLDLAGGPGMIMPMRERKTLKAPAVGKFTYTWHQKSFDPITHDARYGIHFKLKDGTVLNDAFTYDWRLWSVPELRDALEEAGFADVAVYWETEHKGVGTGEYIRMESGDNAYAWVAYIAAMK